MNNTITANNRNTHEKNFPIKLQKSTKDCPYCGEEIFEAAKKCKHCKEFLESKTSEVHQNYFHRPNSNPMKYAGFWLRAIASIIDIPIYIVIYLVASFTAGFCYGSMKGAPDMWSEADYIIIIVFVYLFVSAFQCGYKALMESSSKQGTLGKMALGLKVVDIAGNKISLGRAIGRYWLAMIMSFVPILGLIAICMAGWTRKKQTLYDMACSVTVIKSRG